MRKLALKLSLTLDGFICGPNGEFDWFMKTRSEDGAAWTADKIGQAGVHLMGRKSFESMAAFWPNSTGAISKIMNDIPKITFSKKAFDTSSIPASAKSWKEAQILTGDLTDEIQKLKNQDGKVLVAHGGAHFAQSLVQTGLIDEFWLAIHPVAIGKGIGLFTEMKVPIYLKLIETKSFSSGTVAKLYIR